jgi:hypothetical protein
MIDWIRNYLDPPGTERKNTGAIFSFVGRVAEILLDDSKIAHNAHFPYLADIDKLRQHAKALMIPELDHDKEQLFRDRVAAASFYLSKAGERGFIMGELESRFGNRFDVVEKFLQLRVKLIHMSENERGWIYSLLDSLIDPVVYLEMTDWFRVMEKVCFKEALSGMKASLAAVRDIYMTPDARSAMEFLKLSMYMNDVFFAGLKFDGASTHNGEHKADGCLANAVRDRVSFLKIAPARVRERFPEPAAASYKRLVQSPIKDVFFMGWKFDGTSTHNGEHKADAVNDRIIAKARPSIKRDSVKAKDSLRLGLRHHHFHDGRHKADGSVKFNSGILQPL